MKTLLQKEIRENIKLASVALLAGVVLLLLTAYTRMGVVRGLATGATGAGDYDTLQPLVSEVFNSGIHLFCALFGLILGWLQLQSEKPRDLWAFLVHRPLTRTGIFLGKAVADTSPSGGSGPRLATRSANACRLSSARAPRAAASCAATSMP